MANFVKEREKWPESRKLMGLLIDGPTAATPPSGVQPELNDLKPNQATPSRDAAIISAPIEDAESETTEQESAQ
jgi:hypothetical protein